MSKHDFNNKTFIVTGGTDGIGKALCVQLLDEGANVVTCGRSPEKVAALSLEHKGKNLLALRADISQEEDCRRLINEALNRFGKIDCLINNAGVSMRSEFKDADLDVFRKVMDINYFGVLYCTKFALDSIIKNKGSIVGISSIAGYRGLPGRSGYSASKFALNGWMEALRTELLETGVNVLWASPGFTQSNIRNAALTGDGSAQGDSPMEESKLMTAEEAAEKIINAIANRKRSLIFSVEDKRTVILSKFFPALTDKLVRKFFYKNGQLIK